MKRPDFVPVVPDEVEEYGANAALVLSLIRFRCEVDGDDRINCEGVRWWEVSHSGIGQQVGLSVKAVRRALERLGDRVSAKYLARDGGHPNAYRTNEAVTSSSPVWPPSDQQLAHLGTPHPNGVGGPPHLGMPPYPKRANSPICQESKKGEEAAVSAADEPERPAQHESGNAHPPPIPSEANSEPTVGRQLWWIDPHGRPRCQAHKNWTLDKPCGACGTARKAYEAHQAAAVERQRERDEEVRRLRKACKTCGGTNWITDDNDEPIEKCDHREAAS